MDSVSFRLKGLSPMLHHSSRLANPFDPYAVAIKDVTSKKKKTEEDAGVIYWLEWCGSLYVTQRPLPSEADDAVVGAPIVPEDNILSLVNDGARHQTRGQGVWRGITVVGGHSKILGSGWPERSAATSISSSSDVARITPA